MVGSGEQDLNWFLVDMMTWSEQVSLFFCNDTWYPFTGQKKKCEYSEFVDFGIGGWIRRARQMNWFVVDIMNWCQFNDLAMERYNLFLCNDIFLARNNSFLWKFRNCWFRNWWLDPVSKTNKLICRRHEELMSVQLVQRSGIG